ncbi:MAG TPA: dihydroxy-acid dehydratase, partial [Candidatus Deferrimicrobium sp.]|nr:dihydroxy-acid dehydratase [Candidatus Deferrimicrobium sp.]
FMIAHVTPEAALRGPLAAVRDGDMVTIDVDSGRIDLDISDAEMAERLRGWTPPPPRYPSGALAKYAATVGSASLGALTSPVPAPDTNR